MKNDWISLITLLALVLTGCGASAQDRYLTPSEPLVPPAQETEVSSPENPVELGNTPEAEEMPSNPPSVEKFVDLSKKDLASRLQLGAEDIKLVNTKEILWPNAALGCPAPGTTYAQGKVPGFEIWLEADGVEHIYHTDWVGQVILCSIPTPDDSLLPEITDPTPQIGVPID